MPTRGGSRGKLDLEDTEDKAFESLMLARRDSGELYEDVVEYPNGDQYQGQLKNGLMHGRGKFAWANGDMYQGEWKKGKMEGKGRKFQMDSGITEEGHYLGNLLVGPVKRTMQATGDTFVGLSTGFGTYTWKADEYMYRGQWKEDIMHGSGHWFPIDKLPLRKDYPDVVSDLRLNLTDLAERSYGNETRWIRSHKGKYDHGMRCGFGSAELLDGSVYHGDWQDDLFHGNGRLLYSPLHREAIHDFTRGSVGLAGEQATDFELPEPGRSGINNTPDLAVEVKRCASKVFIAYSGEFRQGYLHGRGCVYQECTDLPPIFIQGLSAENDPPKVETTYRLILRMPALMSDPFPGLMGFSRDGSIPFDLEMMLETLTEQTVPGDIPGSGGTHWSVHKMAHVYYGFVYQGTFERGEAVGAGVITNRFLPEVSIHVNRTEDNRWEVVSHNERRAFGPPPVPPPPPAAI